MYMLQKNRRDIMNVTPELWETWSFTPDPQELGNVAQKMR